MGRTILIFTLVINLLLTGMLSAQDKLPGREERIYSLSTIWKEMQYSFVFPETFQQVNIDSLYLAYIPRIEQVKNNYEYYHELNAFMAHFNDGHTRIYAANRPDDAPPLTTINFGEKIIVNNIAKNWVDKIPVGSEIIEINHIPVIEYVKDSIYPYISAGTPLWKFDKSVSEMLYGEPQSKVTITVKTPNGKEREVKMIRNYSETKEDMVDTTDVSPINIKIIDKNIGYIQFASCQQQYISTIHSTFLSWVPKLRNCKGLIIDIRGNRGGTSQAWMMIAACLTQSINEQGTWFSRKQVPTYKMWGEYNPEYKDYYQGTAMEEIHHNPITTNIPDTLQLHQPLIIISGAFVGSASEFFLNVMKETKRATIIGEPSVGCVSEPMLIPLPGGFEAMIATKKYVNPDGSQSNKTGILPDIEVKRDYNAYLKGEDNVLEQAIEELQKQKG